MNRILYFGRNHNVSSQTLWSRVKNQESFVENIGLGVVLRLLSVKLFKVLLQPLFYCSARIRLFPLGEQSCLIIIFKTNVTPMMLKAFEEALGIVWIKMWTFYISIYIFYLPKNTLCKQCAIPPSQVFSYWRWHNRWHRSY